MSSTTGRQERTAVIMSYIVVGPPKNFKAKLMASIRLRNAILQQNQLTPFTHKIDLSFKCPIDDEKFRQRLSETNREKNFHVIWTVELSKKQDHDHYHGIVNTTKSIEDLKN